jgi:hypothetical protein
MGYGADITDLFTLAAKYVAKILTDGPTRLIR